MNLQYTNGKHGKEEFIMIGLYLLLGFISVFSIYSATYFNPNLSGLNLPLKQAIWIFVGGGVAGFVSLLSPHFYKSKAYVFYGITLFVLLALALSGTVSKDVARWIVIGPIKIQPSEFAKITTILALAKYLEDKKISTGNIKEFLRVSLIAGLIVGVPAILILTQPDLGTSLALFFLIPIYIFWQGTTFFEIVLISSPIFTIVLAIVSIFNESIWVYWLIYIVTLFLIIYKIYIKKGSKFIGVAVIVLNVIMGLITPQIWNGLKEYQQKRIITFVNPESDPRGAGYQVIQSKIAISSGGFTGKGWMEGTQTKNGFLPESQTDFIFSSYSEQFGFVGSAFLLLVYLAIIYMILYTILGRKKGGFVNLYLIGISGHFMFHVLVNVGMTIGLMPVTGLPLILMSYGGSATLSAYILLGLILSGMLYNK